MWNADIKKEFQLIFDGEPSDNPHALGKHIYNKWRVMCEDYGRTAAAAALWPDLDEDIRAQIVKRALEVYSKELKLTAV